MIGPLELIIILFVVVLLFSSSKLPDVMGDLGKAIGKFKEGLKSKDEPDDHGPKR
jgi:TatA/E family protein of Tat protein translocase